MTDNGLRSAWGYTINIHHILVYAWHKEPWMIQARLPAQLSATFKAPCLNRVIGSSWRCIRMCIHPPQFRGAYWEQAVLHMKWAALHKKQTALNIKQSLYVLSSLADCNKISLWALERSQILRYNRLIHPFCVRNLSLGWNWGIAPTFPHCTLSPSSPAAPMGPAGPGSPTGPWVPSLPAGPSGPFSPWNGERDAHTPAQ